MVTRMKGSKEGGIVSLVGLLSVMFRRTRVPVDVNIWEWTRIGLVCSETVFDIQHELLPSKIPH